MVTAGSQYQQGINRSGMQEMPTENHVVDREPRDHKKSVRLVRYQGEHSATASQSISKEHKEMSDEINRGDFIEDWE